MFETNDYPIINQLYCLLFVFGGAAFIAIGYHCVRVGWYNQAHQTSPGHELARREAAAVEGNSAVVLIPAHKFQKGTGLAQEDGTCAVCLCEFQDGDELRTLLECKHSFHVSCIDMWLYSHSTCPICRTNALPSPQVYVDCAC